MASRIDICNQAVALIKAKAMASIGEQSLEARECRRFYSKVVSRMLEMHEWSFANRRVVLALTTNDREYEWLYAYAAPSDLGTAIRVLPDFEGAGLGLPVPVPGEPYAETWSASANYEAAYRLENGIIYANVETATLEYGINSIEEANLTALVEEALSVELASWIAIPVKGDRKLRRELMQEADLHWQRAIADDKNRHPELSGQYVSEAMAARAGYLS